MPESYRRYLINSLRESFDLPGVPLRITIKSGANPYAEGGEKAGPSKTPPRGLKAKAARKLPVGAAARAAKKKAEPGGLPGNRAAKPGGAVVRPRSGPGAKPRPGRPPKGRPSTRGS